MQITLFTGDCTKCKMLDMDLAKMELPCEIQRRFIEEEGPETFVQESVMCIPTMIFTNAESKIKLSGTITPTMVQKAIESL